MSAILGGLAGLAIGCVTLRLYQWWEWRNVPHQAYYAPMSTELPTTTELPTVSDWQEAEA